MQQLQLQKITNTKIGKRYNYFYSHCKNSQYDFNMLQNQKIIV